MCADVSVPDQQGRDNPTNDKPQLGETCLIRGLFEPFRKRTHGWTRSKWWERIPLVEPRTAIFIGYRTVFDGTIDHEFADDGGYWSHFKQTQKHNVWLFVLNERQNPVYVLPQDVQRGEGGAS